MYKSNPSTAPSSKAGVRNLQKHIERVCRKLATKVVEKVEENKGSTAEKRARAIINVIPQGISLLCHKLVVLHALRIGARVTFSSVSEVFWREY